jgi:serine/threonine-protein kinase
MATVYRGMDRVLGRTVAIKTMLPQYATDPSFAARFKQEAQAAAALNSPYIVSVYDWGKDGDTYYYIIMEYLRGTDLKSGIRKHGALDCKKVAQIGSQIAQALSVAHNHDIIHRDIKPQNIMVQPDGNIKVMDFGIARAKNSHLTTDNSVLGTAHYVSPEQTQGKPLGPTTDLYSLGIVMYEAATGRVPFDGDNAVTVAMKQVTEQPVPPSQINPNVDPQLEAIILKCMQKDPKDRFQTADELYHTLHDYLAGRMQAVNNATAMLPATPTTPLSRGNGSTQSLPRTQRHRQNAPSVRHRAGGAGRGGAPEEAEAQPRACHRWRLSPASWLWRSSLQACWGLAPRPTRCPTSLASRRTRPRPSSTPTVTASR